MALRLPLSKPLAEPSARRASNFPCRQMGILDYRRGLSSDLVGGAAES